MPPRPGRMWTSRAGISWGAEEHMSPRQAACAQLQPNIYCGEHRPVLPELQIFFKWSQKSRVSCEITKGLQAGNRVYFGKHCWGQHITSVGQTWLPWASACPVAVHPIRARGAVRKGGARLFPPWLVRGGGGEVRWCPKSTRGAHPQPSSASLFCWISCSGCSKPDSDPITSLIPQKGVLEGPVCSMERQMGKGRDDVMTTETTVAHPQLKDGLDAGNVTWIWWTTGISLPYKWGCNNSRGSPWKEEALTRQKQLCCRWH